MHIVGVETFRLSQRCCLVRIETDTGLVGWGEATLESRTPTVAAAVAELAELLIGEDPGAIERLWQRLRKSGFYRGGPVLGSAVAGIDQALWDIKGKHLGVPVNHLLGGPTRDRVRLYAPVHGSDPAALRDQARARLAAGYTAVKTAPAATLGYLDTPAVYRGLLEGWRELREEIGDDVDLAFDFHGRFSTAASRAIMPAMAELSPLFIEEPQPPELQRDIGLICRSTSIPIATGERLYDRWEAADVLGEGVAVLQPDVSHAYGISEVMRIAATADVHGVHLAPHCATGPVSFAACLQVDLAIDNVLIQECQLDIHDPRAQWWSELVVGEPFRFEGGWVRAPHAPGLGIEIDEDRVRAAARCPDEGRSPVWSLPDGSYAEW